MIYSTYRLLNSTHRSLYSNNLYTAITDRYTATDFIQQLHVII